MKHFLSIENTMSGELEHIFDVALELRKDRIAGRPNAPVLAHKTLAMVFEKPSLRTRISFEQAMLDLGGHAVNFGRDEVGLGKRESAADVARVLSGMVHGISARVFEHAKLDELAKHSTITVINALSDMRHPCQALADAMTMMDEFGRDLSGRTIAFIGDGNNVARSLAALSARLGIHFILACPRGYELEESFIGQTRRIAGSRSKVEVTHDYAEAARHADVLYTDTWVSMGQEEEAAIRKKAFEGCQINDAMLKIAPKHAIVLHCLPAYRGLEISESAMEGPQSRVFPQAHNRLHAQKGLLAILMGGM